MAWLKKYWLFIVLATIATVLGFLWFNKPEKVEHVTLPKIQATNLPGRSFHAQLQVSIVPSFDPRHQEAKIITFKNKEPIDEARAVQIAQSLGFSDKPLVSQDILRGLVYAWTQADSFLTITSGTHEIAYGRDLLIAPPSISGSLPSSQSAQEQFNQVAQKIGFVIPKENIAVHEKFITLDGPIPVETNENDALFIEVRYTLQLNGLKVVNHDPNMAIAYAWFGRDGKIAKLVFRNPIANVQQGQTYPLKDKQEILGSLVQDGHAIVIGDGSFEYPEATSLNAIILSSAELAYLLPETGSTLEPIFIFRGEVLDNVLGNYPIIVYLPALKKEFYK